MVSHPRHDFVDLRAAVPDSAGSPIQLDIRYARNDNFMGTPVYPSEDAFLQAPVLKSLLRVHRALAPMGYGILVFDGYRPWSVTKLFWDRASEIQRQFLANPETGSNHNRGCAVDCSLYSLETGLEIRMPSEFDEMNETAWSQYAGGTSDERARRDLLIESMHAEGFKVLRNEWWHFNHPTASEYPIFDLTFEQLRAELTKS